MLKTNIKKFVKNILGFSLILIILGAFAVTHKSSDIVINAAETGVYNGFEYLIANSKVTITKYTNDIETELVIPDKIKGYPVTIIGEWAFSDCRNLTIIVIPDSVTIIGDSAFSQCSALKSIIIPNSVTSIGSGAFFNCYSLEDVSLPDSLIYIYSHVFLNVLLL
ncbi:hypothetical protein FACS1894132_13620 [Clostridia bacterium]|nr:hypothetical protein FACS1894132_13620 [Clostridia bacterium]